MDDSIVRGTTCNEIIQMARDAGEESVLLLPLPMVKYPNVYGIDMPAKDELIAGRVEEIREIIGARPFDFPRFGRFERGAVHYQ